MVPWARLFITTKITGSALLDRHRHRRQLGAHAAVADERDHGPVGLGDLDADRGGRAEAHRRGAARRDEPPVVGQLVALGDAVLVPADVGDQDRVGRQSRAQVGEDPLRPQRELVAAPALAAVGEQRRARVAVIVSRSPAAPSASGCRSRTAAAIACTAWATSATAPIATGKLRPISAGSMSIWMSRPGGNCQV